MEDARIAAAGNGIAAAVAEGDMIETGAMVCNADDGVECVATVVGTAAFKFMAGIVIGAGIVIVLAGTLRASFGKAAGKGFEGAAADDFGINIGLGGAMLESCGNGGATAVGFAA